MDAEVVGDELDTTGGKTGAFWVLVIEDSTIQVDRSSAHFRHHNLDPHRLCSVVEGDVVGEVCLVDEEPVGQQVVVGLAFGDPSGSCFLEQAEENHVVDVTVAVFVSPSQGNRNSVPRGHGTSLSAKPSNGASPG